MHSDAEGEPVGACGSVSWDHAERNIRKWGCSGSRMVYDLPRGQQREAVRAVEEIEMGKYSVEEIRDRRGVVRWRAVEDGKTIGVFNTQDEAWDALVVKSVVALADAIMGAAKDSIVFAVHEGQHRQYSLRAVLTAMWRAEVDGEVVGLCDTSDEALSEAKEIAKLMECRARGTGGVEST